MAKHRTGLPENRWCSGTGNLDWKRVEEDTGACPACGMRFALPTTFKERKYAQTPRHRPLFNRKGIR